MGLIGWIIVLVYGLIIFELLISGIWKTRRPDLTCVKVLAVTIVLTAMFAVGCAVLWFTLGIDEIVPGVLTNLLIATELLTALLLHQVLYVINRRRIVQSKIPREANWKWL